jgi:hypothetical protein
MGVLPVAHSIPLKLTELQHSFTKFCCNGIPKMSKASLHNQIDEVKAYSIRIQVR